MNITISHHLTKSVVSSLIISVLFILGGCSVSDSDTSASNQKPRVLSQRTEVNPPSVTSRIESKKMPVKKVKPYKPQVNRYVDSKPAVRVMTDEEQEEYNKELVRIEKEKREVKGDPYASIPDGSVSSTVTSKGAPTKPSEPRAKSSSAVNSLMVQARAEILIGKHESAESKLERGLRIEPENSKLWALLAKAHYGQSNYSQTINMARKAIRFSRDDDFIAQNWRLIKKAGEKSGDTIAVKDALDYSKVNP